MATKRTLLTKSGFSLICFTLLLLLGWWLAARTNGETAVSAELSAPTEPIITDPNCRYGTSVTSVEQIPWLSTFNVGWFINFGATANPVGDIAYVRMIEVKQNRGPANEYLDNYTAKPALTDDPGQLGQMIDLYPNSIWVIGNEVDRINIQGDTYPHMYARAYHDAYEFIKARDPSAQVAISALVEVTPGRLQYLDKVWESYVAQYQQPLPVDVWTMHLYILPEARPDGINHASAAIALGTDPALAIRESNGTTAQCALNSVYCYAEHDNMTIFAEQVVAMRTWMKKYKQQQKPLIITEYSLLYPYIVDEAGCYLMDEYGQCFPPERVQQFLINSVNYLETASDPTIGNPLDSNRLIQQWLWFTLYASWAGHDNVSNLLNSDYVSLAPGDPAGLNTIGAEYQYQAGNRQMTSNLRLRELSYPLGHTIFATDTVTVDLWVNILNNGNKNINTPYTVTFYADAAMTQIIGEQLITTRTEGCIQRPVRAEVSWPDLGPGRHQYWVKLDSQNTISESREWDNIGTGYVIINPYQLMLPILFHK